MSIKGIFYVIDEWIIWLIEQYYYSKNSNVESSCIKFP